MSERTNSRVKVAKLMSFLYVYKMVDGKKMPVQINTQSRFECPFKHKENYKRFIKSWLDIHNIDYTGIDCSTSFDLPIEA